MRDPALVRGGSLRTDPANGWRSSLGNLDLVTYLNRVVKKRKREIREEGEVGLLLRGPPTSCRNTDVNNREHSQ